MITPENFEDLLYEQRIETNFCGSWSTMVQRGETTRWGDGHFQVKFDYGRASGGGTLLGSITDRDFTEGGELPSKFYRLKASDYHRIKVFPNGAGWFNWQVVNDKNEILAGTRMAYSREEAKKLARAALWEIQWAAFLKAGEKVG